MDFVLEPSLKHMVLVKIAIELCFREDFSWPKNRGEPLYKLPEELVEKVMEKVRALLLPKPLEKELAFLIKPIGEHWARWCEYLYEAYGINETQPRILPWTGLGTIDAKKRAQQLVMDRSLEPTARYTLACDFGLKEQILELSPLIPRSDREIPAPWFYQGHDLVERHFGKFWSYYLSGKELELQLNRIRKGRYRDIFLRQFAFNRAIFSYNPSAVKYFYAKLKPEEKNNWTLSFGWREFESLIMRFRSRRFPADFLVEILRFLFSRMSENQRVEILRKTPIQFLTSLLVWPYQSLFLPNLNRMWEFISHAEFEKLLIAISYYIHQPGKVYYCRYMFIAFWQSKPDKFSRFFFSSGRRVWFWIRLLFDVGEEEICRMIVKEAKVSEWMQILRDDSWRRTCSVKSCEKDGCFTKFFVRECKSSLAAIEANKKALINSHVDEYDDDEMKELVLLLENIKCESK